MGRCLIVANQTAGGAELEDAIRTRVTSGFTSFFVVVPCIKPELEAEGWVPADPIIGIESPDPFARDAAAEAAEEGRRRAHHRLDRLIDRIRELGGEADGEVGPSDPLAAAEAALERQPVDEVIVSTLPAGISRWLKMDLPSRLSRRMPVPVTTIETGA